MPFTDAVGELKPGRVPIAVVMTLRVPAATFNLVGDGPGLDAAAIFPQLAAS